MGEPSHGDVTDAPTTLMPDLPTGNGASPIHTAEFAWEDWWDANTGFLLATYALTGEDAYVLADVTKDDIPALLTLFAYRGLFDRGVYEIVMRNLRGLGSASVVPILAQMVEGKYKFKEGQKSPTINKPDYEWLALRRSATSVAKTPVMPLPQFSFATSQSYPKLHSRQTVNASSRARWRTATRRSATGHALRSVRWARRSTSRSCTKSCSRIAASTSRLPLPKP
ncbi:MAG: hypothetical protein U5N86_09860 [Planctomycetota bacterium]|nr:hypothetical protein [Planctomycetota bacterium]